MINQRKVKRKKKFKNHLKARLTLWANWWANSKQKITRPKKKWRKTKYLKKNVLFPSKKPKRCLIRVSLVRTKSEVYLQEKFLHLWVSSCQLQWFLPKMTVTLKKIWISSNSRRIQPERIPYILLLSQDLIKVDIMIWVLTLMPSMTSNMLRKQRSLQKISDFS